LRIASTNHDNLLKNNSFSQASYFFSSKELNTVLGLAFTAIMAHGHDIALCRAELNIFLKYRDFIQHEDMLEMVTLSVIQLLESGFAAFKVLCFPSYYSEFIWLYHVLISSHSPIPQNIKRAMVDLLKLNFHTEI
jgi:hypothetical protein